MSPSTESPNSQESVAAEFEAVAVDESTADAGAAARASGGRVRGQRLEITPADLTMYSAITGRAPSAEERERALGWSESDPMNSEIAAILCPSPDSKSAAIVPIHAFRPWYPAGLSLRLREMWSNGVTLRVSRPQFGQWFRRLSHALQQGRRRVRQAR
jgi:hypothetical protein